jgi:adenylate cyclase
LAESVTPAIADHGGWVVKNTGEGFLAEFPNAVEAVRAANTALMDWKTL